MKDSKRLILALVLSGILLVIYQGLFLPKQAPPDKTPAISQPAPGKTAPPKATTPAAPTAPAAPAAQPAVPATPAQGFRRITVENAAARLVFNEKGGGLSQVVLKKYFNQPGEKGGEYVLLDLKAADPIALGLNLPQVDASLAARHFQADRDSLKMSGAGSGPSTLSFSAESAGIKVVKTYRFSPDSYAFELTTTLTNQSGRTLEITPEISLVERKKAHDNAYAFTGLEIWRDGSLVEQSVGDLEKNPVESGSVSWMTLNVPYFMGAVVPTSGTAQAKRSVRGHASKEIMSGTLVEPPVNLPPGQSATLKYMIFYGPRDLKVLEPLGHNLAAAVDFGWFDVVAKPMLAALNFIEKYLGNYGVAIIIITIFTKILFFPLAQKSYKSMKAMQKLQPQVMKLRERYKDDKQRMNQEMMQLYRTYKVNPMGGCLPMVVQIPVFIAFYKVLGASIELRHAPFLLWINDLSVPDRLFPDLGIPYVGGLPVLTLLMGASMFIQQKMTPTPGDPSQAKIMLLMPVVFTFMFINFPSGLVLYWLANNILSIGQQYWTNKIKKA